MPKNTVNDPITDQEIAFAHLVLSGTMNDRAAAEAVGLNPDTAHAWIKERCALRQFRCRGQEKTSMEATWACLSYNIIRWFSIQRKLKAAAVAA